MTDPLDTLGKRMRWSRGNSSQEEFGSRLGVHKETVGKYERDLINPGADVLAKLHELRGVNANWLLSGKGNRMMSESAAFVPEALEAAVVAVEERLNQRGLVLAPEKKAKIITFLYEQMIGGGKIDSVMLNHYLDLAS